MTIELYQVDAFTHAPFAGNPAAVCVQAEGLDPSMMQAIAEEMNLSETAFVGEPGDRAERAFRLRWFTPAAEVELCGHATLASAAVLWEAGRASKDQPIVFDTRFAGPLTCRRQSDGLIGVELPIDRPEPGQPPEGLLHALGLAPSQVNHGFRGKYDLVLELIDETAVRRLRPDFAALAAFDCRGIAVTARAGETKYLDIVSRFFAPRLRIQEDSVTGSLHCLLGPYWSERLGRRNLVCEQASARGGIVRVAMPEPSDASRQLSHVQIAGQTVTVARIDLTV